MVGDGFAGGEAGFDEVAMAVVERGGSDAGGIGGGDCLTFAVKGGSGDVSTEVAVGIVATE